MTKNKDKVYFYSEKLMKDGKMHYSVCSYDRVTGELSYPSDFMTIVKNIENN